MGRIPQSQDEISRPLKALAPGSGIIPFGVVPLVGSSGEFDDNDVHYMVDGENTSGNALLAANGATDVQGSTKCVLYSDWPRYANVNCKRGTLKDYRNELFYLRNQRLFAIDGNDDFVLRLYAGRHQFSRYVFALDRLPDEFRDEQRGYGWVRPIMLSGFPVVSYSTTLDEFEFLDSLTTEDDLTVAFPFLEKFCSVRDQTFVGFSSTTINTNRSELIKPREDDQLKLDVYVGGDFFGLVRGFVDLSCEAEFQMTLASVDISDELSSCTVQAISQLNEDSVFRLVSEYGCDVDTYGTQKVYRYSIWYPFWVRTNPAKISVEDSVAQDASGEFEPLYSLQLKIDGFDGGADVKTLRFHGIRFTMQSVPPFFSATSGFTVGWSFPPGYNASGYLKVGEVT